MSYQREYQRRIDVGVVGVGGHAYRNILPALNFLPVRLKAVADVNLELARTTAAQYGARAYSTAAQMYAEEKLEAVLIAVSPKLHPELAIQAFGAGLHVWLEKPVARRASEVQAMIAARGDRIAVVGYKKVFMPSAQKALEVVGSTKYGNLVSVLGVYPMDIPADGSAVLAEGRMTNWLANGCHPLSLLIAAAGPVRAVTTLRGERGGGACVLEFESGVIGNLHLASGPNPIEHYAFFGKSWHLNIWDSRRVELQRGIPFEYGKTDNYAPAGNDSGAVVWEPQNMLSTLENQSVVVQGIYGELLHFCTAVTERRPPTLGTLEFALDVQRAYEAALVSQGDRVPTSGR